MPETRSVTFRDQTTGRISDLLSDEGQPCAHTQNLLAYLVGALQSYKEEGVEFTPSIALCNSLVDFLKVFPGAVSHAIGTAPLDFTSGPRILKDCAPLTSRNWFIFIERVRGEMINYGVFTYFRLPTAIPLPEGICIDPAQFCVLVRRISTNTIEIRGAKGNILTLVFSTIRESGNLGTPIEKFAAACCSGIADKNINSEFRTYFFHLLEASLASSHGTILVCRGEADLAPVPKMQDAVKLSPILDFQAAFREYQTAKTAGSILNLQRCEELLEGFLRCDGIVMFDLFGCVTAYRVFFRPTTASAAGKPSVDGGARLRAFEGIKGLVGKHLTCALFRSQDGLTLHHGVTDRVAE